MATAFQFEGSNLAVTIDQLSTLRKSSFEAANSFPYVSMAVYQ